MLTDYAQRMLTQHLTEPPPVYVCPVCWWRGLDEPAYDERGSCSYDICSCCGTHFGVSDYDVTHSDLRRRWAEKGCPWWSESLTPPESWSGAAQLVDAYEETVARLTLERDEAKDACAVWQAEDAARCR